MKHADQVLDADARRRAPNRRPHKEIGEDMTVKQPNLNSEESRPRRSAPSLIAIVASALALLADPIWVPRRP